MNYDVFVLTQEQQTVATARKNNHASLTHRTSTNIIIQRVSRKQNLVYFCSFTIPFKKVLVQK